MRTVKQIDVELKKLRAEKEKIQERLRKLVRERDKALTAGEEE